MKVVAFPVKEKPANLSVAMQMDQACARGVAVGEAHQERKPVSRIVQRVTACSECPNCEYYSGGFYRCEKLDQTFHSRGKPTTIPDWCPLESGEQQARKPMNQSEIEAAYERSQQQTLRGQDFNRVCDMVRAVEAFHGIKTP